MTGSQLAMRQQAARAVGRTDSRVCVDRRAPTGAREVLAKRHRRSGPEPSPRAQRGMTDSQRWCSGWWWAQSSFLGDAGRWGGCKIGVLGECLGSWAERWLRRRRAALQAHTRSPLPRRLPGAPEGARLIIAANLAPSGPAAAARVASPATIRRFLSYLEREAHPEAPADARAGSAHPQAQAFQGRAKHFPPTLSQSQGLSHRLATYRCAASAPFDRRECTIDVPDNPSLHLARMCRHNATAPANRAIAK